MVDLQNYNSGADNQVMFGGNATMQEVDNLNKALEAQNLTGRETTNLTTTSGAPLKVESLDKTLKVLTYTEKELTLWSRIKKTPAYNTVEEYNQLVSYGADRGGFNREGELPVEEDSTYVRRAQLVKFLGVTKSVTHPMTLVNTMIGDAIDREAKNGTLWLLRKLNRGLYFGNEAMVPEEFNGFLSQHQSNDAFPSFNAYMNSEIVIDLRGKVLSEEAIESGANGIIENFGLATSLYAPPVVLSNFVKKFYGNKFIQPNTNALTDGVMGQRVKSFESQFGNIDLNYDIFFNKNPQKTSASVATSANAPIAPVVSAVTPVAVDALGKWFASDAGTYLYAVSAINRYGESVLTVFATPAAIVSGGAVDITFTASPSTYNATSFQIYRSQAGALVSDAIYSPLFTVSLPQLTAGYDGGAVGVIRDRNRFMPNCNQALLMEESDEVMEFKQLAPLMKMDLAVVGPAFRFMVLLYGTPFLYAPKKMVRFVNIGTDLT